MVVLGATTVCATCGSPTPTPYRRLGLGAGRRPPLPRDRAIREQLRHDGDDGRIAEREVKLVADPLDRGARIVCRREPCVRIDRECTRDHCLELQRIIVHELRRPHAGFGLYSLHGRYSKTN